MPVVKQKKKKYEVNTALSLQSSHGDYYHLSAGLEIVEENVEGLRLFAVVLHNNAGAANHLAGLGFLVELAKTGPLAELLRVGDLDELDVVLKAEGLNELDVRGLLAVLSQNAKVSLATIKGLGALVQTTSKTIVDQSTLQDLLNRGKDSHVAARGALSCCISVGHFLDGFCPH